MIYPSSGAQNAQMWPASQWLVATAVFGLCCMACDGASTPPVSTGKLQDLYSRNLNLPSLAPGADCPVSAKQIFNSGNSPTKRDESLVPISEGYGTWPVFLSGQDRWFAGEAASLFISPEYDGPLIVRGHQLDGSAGMPLEASGEQGSTAVGEHGVEFAPSRSTKWREWAGRITSGIGLGCYGLQVDGITFTSQIVFAVQAGPPPPG